QRVSWPRGAARQQLRFALTPGAAVRGKVVEADSGKPVAQAWVGFHPAADAPEAGGLPRNGTLYPHGVQARDGGTFQAPPPPGPWNVLVAAPKEEYVYQKIAAAEFAEGRAPRDGAIDPDAWAKARLRTEAPAELTFRLRRAALRGRVVGPDGRPV